MKQKKERTKEERIRALEKSIEKFGDYDGSKTKKLKELKV